MPVVGLLVSVCASGASPEAGAEIPSYSSATWLTGNHGIYAVAFNAGVTGS